MPLTEEDPIFLYEEEAEAASGKKPWTGIFKPLFRALGFNKPVDNEVPESAKIAKRKSNNRGGAFER